MKTSASHTQAAQTAGTESIHRMFLWQRLKKQKEMQLVMIPLALWAIAMFYLPILGNVIAFQNYNIKSGFLHSKWVGLKHFVSFFNNVFTLQLIRNTLAMSILGLVFGTLASVAFAILLNELYARTFKKVIQTISYLPYFVSMAVAANLFIQLLSRTGPINQLLISTGLTTQDGFPFLEQENLFWIVITAQSVWKNVGWNAIIYLAAITGISEDIYEAAYVDGAGRFKRIWYITLPCILPTVAVLLIMNSGYIMMGGFEQQLLMFNPMVMDYAEVINTYVYKRGIGAGEYSFATAVGMFQSVVSILILFVVNKASKKYTGVGLW